MQLVCKNMEDEGHRFQVQHSENRWSVFKVLSFFMREAGTCMPARLVKEQEVCMSAKPALFRVGQYSS
jgi:hypothetical protein